MRLRLSQVLSHFSVFTVSENFCMGVITEGTWRVVIISCLATSISGKLRPTLVTGVHRSTDRNYSVRIESENI